MGITGAGESKVVIQWETVSKEMMDLFVALNEIDHDIYQDKSEVRILCTVIRNTGAFIALLNDYRSPVLRINANLPDLSYVAAIHDIHRTFLTGLHTYFEQGILDFANRLRIPIQSSRRNQLEKVLARLAGRVTSRDQKHLRRLVPSTPSNQDIVEAVIAILKDSERIKVARDFLKAFAVIRNTVSHSDPTLTDSDVKTLELAGFEAWIEGHKLRASFPNYPSLVRKLVILFRDLDAAGETLSKPDP